MVPTCIRHSIAWYLMYQDAVEVIESCNNLFCLLTGYIFTGDLLPQYHKLMELHVGERHNGMSL